MFTGIIEDLGTVRSCAQGRTLRLTIGSELFREARLGDSICVNGVCLTIAAVKKDAAGFDVISETKNASNLGGIKKGERVNLERPLKLGDKLGGHIVSGHVDRAGRIIRLNRQLGDCFLAVGIPKEDSRFLVKKGSVALDGVSLTVSDIRPGEFAVRLIPHTLKNTNLQFKKNGDFLNVEYDQAGKYFLNLIGDKAKGSVVTEDFLRRHGF
jgi:riboflavin synthase